MSDLERRSPIELGIDQFLRRDPITRRTFMRRAGRGGVALGALMTIPGLLAACSQPAGSGGWMIWPMAG